MFWKKACTAGLAVLVLGVTMIATASASELFLFGGQTGTISEGAGTLSILGNSFSIECKKAAGKVEMANDSETFKGEIELKECTATGLGLPSGTLKFKFKGLLCLWGSTETELKPCAYSETTEVLHLEIPLIGLIDFLIGSSQACKLEPDGVSTTTLTMKCEKGAEAGDQLLTEVKDLGTVLKPAILILQNHAGEEKHGAVSATFKISFAQAGQLDA
jgi:hypothetical protein